VRYQWFHTLLEYKMPHNPWTFVALLIPIFKIASWLPWPFSFNLPQSISLRVIPYSFALSLIPNCSTWELIVLDGIVSRFIIVLPSRIIFQSRFRHISTLTDESHRLCYLHRCPYCYGGEPLGVHPFRHITVVYL